MAFCGFVVLLCASLGYVCCVSIPRQPARKFPDQFIFGAATASYQVEGGWNVDGKSENIWDHFTHNQPDSIKDRSNGDIAANSYHLYERDVQMLRELGVDFYRFSLSWTRILPTGFPDYINEAGVQYYNNLINELLKYNIEPMVTIFHWDLPQKLQDLGGWANPDIVTWFSDYARTVFTLFGDRVKYFITINEPTLICYYGYGENLFAPGVNIKGIAEYTCAKNVLLAHAKAYHIYNNEFRALWQGNIFISLSALWYEPDSENDEQAFVDTIQFYWGQYAWPIFSETGDFPPEMKKRIAAKSAEQGFPRSRLPEFTPEEIELIKGSSDFFVFVDDYTQSGSSTRTLAVPGVIDRGYGPLLMIQTITRSYHLQQRGADSHRKMTTNHDDVVLCICMGHVCVGAARHPVREFPEGFLFGTATAAYQIEGGWNADGKSENIWDHFTHTRPESIKDHSNGDIAANSYHLYERDVQMLRELGVDFYRFSISWSRILPTSFPNYINEAGVQYYNNLINELLKYNIQPMLTIFHWDLPQNLQDLGGWANPDVVTWFSDYARTVFTLFGDRVKYFITINEPAQICYYGYGTNLLAPGVNIKGIAEYMCAKNVLLAHAKAYHIYDKEFRPIQNGVIFISISAFWYEPESENYEEAALDTIQFYWEQYSWPIFSETGDFPPEMKKRIAVRSAEQGFPKSRLPEFTAEERELLKGSSDFFGVNHYTSYYVYRNSSVPPYDVPSFDDDLGVAYYQLKDWQIGDSDFTASIFAPWGFSKLLNFLRLNYKNPPVFITENGFSSYGGLNDDDRVRYFREYLEEVLNALDDGCDVRGYTAWSLMDNFEWNSGYTERFGLYEVNFESKNLTRTARKSAYVYKEILRTRRIDHHYEPNVAAPITIDPGH